MQTINAIMNAVFGRLVEPLCRMGSWPGMIAASLVCAVIVLLLFRLTSDPAAVRREKNRALARMLECLLFRHDPVAGLGAVVRVVRADLAYLRTMILPLVVSVVPVLLMIAQVHLRFGSRPLRIGETAIVRACLPESVAVMSGLVHMRASDNIVVETAAVRVPARNEIAWRVRAGEQGQGWIELGIGSCVVRKSVQIGSAGAAVSPRRTEPGLWKELLNPAEPPLPGDAPVLWIETLYPATDLELAGLHCHWLLVFLLLTMAMGLIVKKPLGIEL